MASTEWLNFTVADTVANNEAFCVGPARASWENPGSVLSAGGGEAHVPIGYGNPFTGDTNFLRVRGLQFGTPLPRGATIHGIEIRVFKRYTTLNQSFVSDCHAHIVKGGVIGAAERAISGAWPNAYVVYGGPTDLWGESWSDTDVQASDFGFVVSARWTGFQGACDGFVDHIQGRIHYDIGGAFFLVM